MGSEVFGEDVYRDQLYTELQSRILINVPRLTGAMSIVGSSTIIYIILRDRKQKLKRVYHRLLLAYSTVDVLCSTNFALSSVVVPTGTPGVWGASGTWGTCEASGFVYQFGFSLGLYSSFICLYYVLVLKFRFREVTIARRIEPVVHTLALLVPLIAGIFMLRLDMYSPTNINVGWCFMNCYPMDCLRNDDIECERGGDYEKYLLLNNLPFALFFMTAVVSCLLTLHTIRTFEARGRRWALNQNISRVRVRESTTQALLYIGAFVTTYIFFGVSGLLGPSPGTEENRTFYFWMVLMIKMFLPLQGVWNFIIYVRPRYSELKRRSPELGRFAVLLAVVSGSTIDRTSLDAFTSQASMVRGSNRSRRFSSFFFAGPLGRSFMQSSGSVQLDVEDKGDDTTENVASSGRQPANPNEFLEPCPEDSKRENEDYSSSHPAEEIVEEELPALEENSEASLEENDDVNDTNQPSGEPSTEAELQRPVESDEGTVHA